ncbi:MAG: ArsA family ATPase [Candidatus Bipolaricaulia bacterium]
MIFSSVTQEHETKATQDGMPSFLNNEDLRLIIFGGKGGTGKTTSAAATAVYLAQRHPAKNIVVISTDPAHSLGDSLSCSVRGERTSITRNLSALELDPAKSLETFKADHKRRIEELVQRSGFYGQVDIKEFLSFSLPGMEEIMIFMEMAKLFKSTWQKRPGEDRSVYRPRCDVMILDTAPTGHTLRLLSLPQRMEEWIEVLDESLNKYRTHPRLYATSEPRRGGDWVDRFVEQLHRDMEWVGSLLTNAETTEFVPVIIPERMAIAETEDLLLTLEERGIAVRNIIINRTREDRECVFCSSQRGKQKMAIAEIEEKFSSYRLIEVPLFPYEIRGDQRLAEYAERLAGETHQDRQLEPSRPQPSASFPVKLPELLTQDLKFILFGGKGGVGKTSVSAATALHVARCYPQKKVLVYSIDPAHSLADSFDYPIGDRITQVPGIDNLYALETDAERLFENFMGEYRALIKDAFDIWTQDDRTRRRLALQFDRNVMSAFSKSVPPGFNELLGLEQIMEFVGKNAYDLYVLDTAPTGHLLELLQFPQLIRDWVKYAYRGLLKWQLELPVTELQELGNRILRSTTAVRKMRDALTDSETSEFVAVTIPEAMGIAETDRLTSAIRKLEIPWRHVIMNQIVPPMNCGFCASKRDEQLKYIQQVKTEDRYRDCLITEIPLFPHEINGMDDLTELTKLMYGEVES